MNKKGAKILRCVTLSRSVLHNGETVQTDPKRRKENIFRVFTHNRVLKYGICSLFPLKNCFNRAFSGSVVN